LFFSYSDSWASDNCARAVAIDTLFSTSSRAENDAKIFACSPCHNCRNNHFCQNGGTRVRRQWQHRQNINTQGRFYHRRMTIRASRRVDLGIDLPPCPLCTNALRPRGVPRDVATGGLSRRAGRRPPLQEATLAFRGDLAASAAGALNGRPREPRNTIPPIRRALLVSHRRH
jgi:hypothetical protein